MTGIQGTLNDNEFCLAGEVILNELISELERIQEFEFHIELDEGPSLTMLRNHDHAWLMYLRHNEDSGFRSEGHPQGGCTVYRLTNGQDDEYPDSWCIDLATCLKAIKTFVLNDGARDEDVNWVED